MRRRQKGEVGGVGGGRRGGKDASLHNREVRMQKGKWVGGRRVRGEEWEETERGHGTQKGELKRQNWMCVGGRRVRWEDEIRKTRAEDRSRRTISRGQDEEDRKPATFFY